MEAGAGGVVVHGNHPISVALTVTLRLLGVPRISARQSNSMLEPTNACEPNLVRLERRCGSAKRYAVLKRKCFALHAKCPWGYE